jgi:hypothetical protein
MYGDRGSRGGEVDYYLYLSPSFASFGKIMSVKKFLVPWDICRERERDREPAEMSYCAVLCGLSGRQQKFDNSGGYSFMSRVLRMEDCS